MEEFLVLDWLAFTMRANAGDPRIPIEQFSDRFPEFTQLLQECFVPRFSSHYTNTLSWNDDLIICYNSYDDINSIDVKQAEQLYLMGVNVQVPSHALATFFELFGLDYNDPASVTSMLQILKDRNCKLSRIDLAYDDFSKTYDVDFYRKAWANDRIQSPFIRSITCMGDKAHGFTFYVGSLKKRDKLLRIYDKGLQSNFKIDSTRYEFECHGDKAEALHDMLLGEYSDGIPFGPFLYGWLKVKVSNASEYSRIDAAPIDSDWENFVFSVNSQFNAEIRIKIPKPDKNSIESELNYFIEHQAMANIAGYVDCFGMNRLNRQIRQHLKHGTQAEKYKRYKQKLIASNEFYQDSKFSDKNPFY